jgi:hypothetical protein
VRAATRSRGEPGRAVRLTPAGRAPAAAASPADLRSRRTLEPAERVAQPRELISESLLARELTLDLLDARLDLLNDRAGAPVSKGKPSGVWVTHQRMRHAEKQLAAQAQASYERMVRDWKAASPSQDVGASVTAERA